MPKNRTTASWRMLIMICAMLSGCSATNRSPVAPDSRQPEVPVALAPAGTVSSAPGSQEAFQALWNERTAEGEGGDPRIGPGDVLRISVPGMDEMSEADSNFTNERVAGDGTFNLPLVGEVTAAGRTESELTEELKQRFSYYMHNPPVKVFVQEYRSRQAGVFGAVSKPGVYDITGAHDTLEDMIAQAGGLSTDAAAEALFSPGAPGQGGAGVKPAAFSPDGEPSNPGAVASETNEIRIDLRDPAQREWLKLPVRAGDTITIPPLGQVMVEGWVNKPGSYTITPNMTVAGAVAAAGGVLYPASDQIRVMRSGPGSEYLLVNLEDIKNGKSPDVAIEDSDVIEVTANDLKTIPYGVYSLFTDVFHMAGYIPVY